MKYFFGFNLSVHYYLLMLLLPMILLNWVRNLKFLTPVSLFAAVITVTGLGITFFYMLQGLPHTSTVKAFAGWKQLPLYFGTAIYAFEGIGMVSIRQFLPFLCSMLVFLNLWDLKVSWVEFEVSKKKKNLTA